ncbi:unnamed protein product, partial [Closterium sp. NIES-54]
RATLLAHAPPLAACRAALAARELPLQPTRRVCSPRAALAAPRTAFAAPRAAPTALRAASAARAPPLQPRAPPLAARPPPLGPLAALEASSPPLAAHAPPLAARAPPLAACSLPLAACAPPSGSALAAPLHARPAACTTRLLPALLLATLAMRRPALPACCSAGSAPPCFARYGFSPCPQVYLLRDSRDRVSLFDHTSGASLAPPATSDSATRSKWLTRDAAARLAIRNHLPLAKCAHFGQHKTAKALYDAVVARYSSPATAALGRLILPYLFPELSAFATVEDFVTHIRTSDTHYCVALPAEFLDRNPPQMYTTLYFIVTRLTDSLRAVRDHILALDPTDLTVDLLEQHLLIAETSVVADVGAASASGKPRNSKGKGGRRSGGGNRGGSGGEVEVVEVVEVVAAVGVVAEVGALVAAVVAAVGVAVVVAVGMVAVGVELFRGEVLAVASGSNSSIRGKPLCPSSFVSGFLSVWRLGFGDEAEFPRWAELLRSGVAIFDLDYNAIIAAMYALSVSAEGDSYLYVPPDPGIEATSLGAIESALPSTASAEALHTFTLDLGASRCFFRDSTTLTPLSASVLVRLADPLRGPVLARSSTVLLCPAVLSGSLSSLHLPSFSTTLVSTAALQDAMVTIFDLHVYMDGPSPGHVAASSQVSASGPVAPPCSCRLLSHQNLLWNHHLGHPSLPRLRDMHSRLLVSGLPRSLPPLPPSPALPCLPCVEERQRAAPHSSSFPPTIAPLQTLHMDFREDLPVLRLHSARGGEFSSDLLRDFCRGEGILQSFMLPESPQQNGIAERHVGLC